MKKLRWISTGVLTLLLLVGFVGGITAEQHPSTAGDNTWAGVQTFSDTLNSDGIFIAKDPPEGLGWNNLAGLLYKVTG